MSSLRAIVTDIEGTTTPIAFVKDVLFPFARARMHAYVRAHREEAPVRAALMEVAEVSGLHVDATDALCATLVTWIDEDRKITALKLLQGLIWDAGYAEGALRAPVYADAARQLRAWHASGLRLYVYSSGSVHAQKLLFRHSDHGNLLHLFSGHFDTTTGGKREAASYMSIAESIGLPPGDVLFLSDVTEELDAAAATGMRTTWLVRPQDVSPTEDALRASAHAVAATFDDIRV
jgi:enolase-phosphatase E1